MHVHEGMHAQPGELPEHGGVERVDATGATALSR